jgi:hypothetical protein
MQDFFRIAAHVTGDAGAFIAVGDGTLVDHDVRYWAGPRSLPLWLPLRDTGFAQRSGRAFLEAGGRTRSMRDTLADVLADELPVADRLSSLFVVILGHARVGASADGAVRGVGRGPH